MYLKKLDIQGFKSFPDKIKLEFNLGITCVVGPNGSGKSNIADAVRWVLGEQSARNLRGGKMEDVIFAGTSNRRPLGLAEVSITIDNTDLKMPIEFSEVTVTRRVFRSGESSYLINGSICRLRDINELFMDTGVGKEGYSIIGQGRVDEILSNKSDDRRLLFDEAAGIVKYKNRRGEAESKLAREQQNLIRVDDILSELESQIDPLFKQSEKARRFLALSERLKLVSVNIFLLEVEKFENEYTRLGMDYSSLQDTIVLEKDYIDAIRCNIKDLKENILLVEDELKNVNDELSSLSSLIVQNEGDIKLYEEQMQHVQQDIVRLESNIENNNVAIVDAENEMSILVTKRNSLILSIESITENLIQKQSLFDKLNSSLSESEIQFDTQKTDLIDKIKETSEIKSNIERTSSLLEHLNARKEQLLKEKSFSQSQINDKQIHIKAQCLRKDELLLQQNNCLGNINLFQNTQLIIDKELESLNQNLNLIYRKINESDSKLKVLSAMEKEHEGFYKSVKAVLKLKDKLSFESNGIAGAVGQLLTVPAHLETAIEIALGSNLQSIITRTEEDAKIAIEYLKKNKLGRATFLPVFAIKSRDFSVADKDKLINENAVLGIAKELVTYDCEFENIMSNLLGKVLIVDGIQNAIVLAKKYKYSFKIVTIEGELLNPGGALTGGSINKTTNIFSRSREIGALKATLEKLSVDSELAKQKIATSIEQKRDCALKLSEAHQNLQEIKISLAQLVSDIEQTNAYILEITSKIKQYDLELVDVLAQSESAFIFANEYSDSLNILNEEIKNIQNSLADFQNSLSEDKLLKEKLLSDITEYKVDLSSKQQEQKAISDNIFRLDKGIHKLNTEINQFQKEIKQLENEQVEKIESIEKMRDSLLVTKKARAKKQLNVTSIEEKKVNLNIRLSEQDEALQQKTEHLSLLNNELFKIKSKLERIELDRQHIYDKMWDDYEVTFQTAKKYENLSLPLSALQKEERSLKNKIKELGSINVGAVEEYKQVKERFDFLQAQRQDITEAEDKLRHIIDNLIALMETKFKEQFEIISQNFSVVFTEMFGGGKAHVKLTDENNVLTSGIEIVAQPPGKTLQSMSLLSGGERALTAIALLFAIQKMKPSPFCILDEIEAALDDANVRRYAAYLKKLTKNTQFIVVTHRKGTMEAADILYGVTMQEQGVSKLVSVKFEEAISN